MRTTLRHCAMIALLASGFASVTAQTVPSGWETYYEKSGFKATPGYEQTMEYCRKVERSSRWVNVTDFGLSPQGRKLPLVILSSDRAFTPAKAAATGKAIILIQNGIHSGEIDGKDACLMLMRDIAITKKHASLLDHVIVLIIPIFSVDGHERFGKYNRINQNGPEEMGWRTTAQNLNLNRDYLKADAPEMQGWLKLFSAWLPDFLVDCHVTDGADYQYSVTYSIETHEMMPRPVRGWITDTYLPSVLGQMNTAGIKIGPYVYLRDDTDPSKGMMGGTAPPRFSTQYAAVRNRPGLLIETHMLKDYKTRVEGTYQLLLATLRLLNSESASLRRAVATADRNMIEGLHEPFPIRFELVDTPNDTIHYLGYVPKVEPSDVSGGQRVLYTPEPFEADIPRYDSVKVARAIVPPAAYLIPPEWTEVIRRLGMHGLAIKHLKKEIELEVDSYRFSGAKWQEKPYEGRHPVTYSVRTETGKRRFPPGTAVVLLRQRAAGVAIHALEPEAPDAFAAWGFFDAVFEQKEYAEEYVMETVSREMIARDPALKSEFDEKVRSDTAFAKSPSARLNFFYQRSPYWDPMLNLYPVARLMDENNLPAGILR
jgi:hypothetical protein